MINAELQKQLLEGKCREEVISLGVAAQGFIDVAPNEAIVVHHVDVMPYTPTNQVFGGASTDEDWLSNNFRVQRLVISSGNRIQNFVFKPFFKEVQTNSTLSNEIAYSAQEIGLDVFFPTNNRVGFFLGSVQQTVDATELIPETPNSKDFFSSANLVDVTEVGVGGGAIVAPQQGFYNQYLTTSPNVAKQGGLFFFSEMPIAAVNRTVQNSPYLRVHFLIYDKKDLKNVIF